MSCAPLVSGRAWTPDPTGPAVNEPQGISNTIHVRDTAEPRVLAVVKRRGPKATVYAIGMERVAYRLALELGLPVSDTHLETYAGQPASVQIKVVGRSWMTSVGAPMVVQNIVNESLIPLAVAFDIWTANTDRNPGNVLMEAMPPGAHFGAATGGRFWLIDHGQCGLWPGWKLDATGQVNDIPDDPSAVASGCCHPRVEQWIRAKMIPHFAVALVRGTPDVRRTALDAIQAVDDDAIAEAVREVSTDYFTVDQARTLMAFLQSRRNAVDKIVETYW